MPKKTLRKGIGAIVLPFDEIKLVLGKRKYRRKKKPKKKKPKKPKKKTKK